MTQESANPFKMYNRTLSNKNKDLKLKLSNDCQVPRFCGICLNEEEILWAIDTEYDITIGQKTHKKNLKDIIEYILNDEYHQIPASPHLCGQCKDKSIQSYHFIYNAKELSNIVHKCVNDLFSKTLQAAEQLEVLKSTEFPNSNIVMVLEKDAQMFQYTDIISKIIKIDTREMLNIKSESIKSNEISYLSDSEVLNHTDSLNINPVTEQQTIGSDLMCKDKIKGENNMSPEKSPTIQIENINISDENSEVLRKIDHCHNVKIIDIKADRNFHDEFNYEEDINLRLDNLKMPGKRKKMAKLFLTHKCNKCKEILPSYKSWKEHEKNCYKSKMATKNKFKCKICSEKFLTQRSLNTHYKTHSKIRCKVCQYFVPQEDMTEHMKLNHEDYIHLCKLCKFFSFNADVLKAHMMKNHNGSKCALCFKKVEETELKFHKCRFSCVDCNENVCIHYKYLVSYREQILNNVDKIKCVDCDYICPRREALLGHVNREHLDHHPFTCDHCSQQFYSRTTLRYHLNQFHRERQICDHCDQAFSTKLNLNDHRGTCGKIEGKHKCDECTSSFNTLEELANHVGLRHKDNVFNCNLCQRKFLTSLKLQEHMFKVHNGLQMKRKKSILNCPLCESVFKNKKQLMQHIEIHGSNIRFPCKDCGADFDNIKKLHAHVRIHYDDVIQCADCKKVLTTTFFPNHLVYCKTDKAENELYTCETCGKTYNSKNQFKLHLKNHLQKVPCPVCNKPTKPLYLKNHIKYMHSKPRKPKKVFKGKTKYFLKCDQCSHLVSRQGELEAHINRYHLKIKPYQCNYCQKSFFGKERLKDHLITHTTSKMCCCSVCNKTFQNNACLKLHMRRHTGYTPYACEMCGERFRTSSIMNTHKVKKHSNKTISCPLCFTMFHLTREMRSHFKKVHWKQKDKKFDPRDVKELKPEFYHLFEDGRLPKVEGEGLYISSKCNEKFD